MAKTAAAPDKPLPESLKAALEYAALGWRVHPLKPCAKSPLLVRWPKRASTDAAKIRRWWQMWPDANVGIATGGLLVLDVDGPKGAASVAGKHLPVTPCVRTGNGGWHYYYTSPAGVRLGSRTRLLPGLDVRAEGGYAVAPPSLHPDTGDLYEWAAGFDPDDLPLAPAPDWLVELLARRRSQADADALEAIPEGRRSDTLARLAGTLRADGTPQAEMRKVLLEVNATRCKPPLPEAEVLAIVASIGRYPAGANGPTVRVSRKVLLVGLSAGALALYCTRQALLQDTGTHPRQTALAAALGACVRSVKGWAAELRRAGMGSYERPARRFVRVTVALLCDPALTPGAKVTALHLAAYVNGDGGAKVSQLALARSTGFCLRSVRYHLEALCKAGHLRAQVASFSGELGRRERCNTYHFMALTPPAAVDLKAGKVQQVAYKEPPEAGKVQQVACDSRP